jgi:uncharacterized phage protein gp47/JayE
MAIKEVTMHQAEIEIDGKRFTVTNVPTATSGSWYTIQDPFEMWAAVAIDLDGTVVGWRNPPDSEEFKTAVEKAIKEAFAEDFIP